MRMSVDECFKCWLPSMVKSLGALKAREACDRMRPIIERAKAAEREGRITDMQPLMAMVNPTEDVKRGIWRLQIRYHPIENGVKGAPLSWTTTILKEQENEPTATAQAGAALEG